MMMFKIVLENDVYDEIMVLMKNIDNINDGNEIGGWLTGKWSKESDEIVLTCDKFIIPEQEVSGAEVDMAPENLVSLVKSNGTSVANNIKCHWHIHPFTEKDAEWSGVDEDKIKSFMDPIKKRDIFVFILSSKTDMKARIELNVESYIGSLGVKFNTRKSVDNVQVSRKNSYVNETEIKKKLENEIKKKVKMHKSNILSYTSETYDANKQESVSIYTPYKVYKSKKKVIVKMFPNFYDYVKDKMSHELSSPNTETLGKKCCTYEFHIKNKNMVKKCVKLFNDELEQLYEYYWNDRITDDFYPQHYLNHFYL